MEELQDEPGLWGGSEEEPEEEPDEESPAVSAAAPSTPLPAVVADEGRRYEFRTDFLSSQEVQDGHTLAERLTAASAEGWDLVDILALGDRHALLLRRPRRVEREPRPVGFTPPAR